MEKVLQDECGVTRISIENFNLLKSKDDDGYYISMEWDNGFSLVFTGLSWGYGGEGCRGFKDVLVGCGFNCDMEYVARLGKKENMTWEFS